MATFLSSSMIIKNKRACQELAVSLIGIGSCKISSLTNESPVIKKNSKIQLGRKSRRDAEIIKDIPFLLIDE